MILKRTFDLLVTSAGLVLFSPLLAAVMLAIWLQDRKSPFYIAPRAGRGGGEFRMVKFRSMVVNADKIGGSSTAATDRRITPVGRFVRACKLDELIQLWNVLAGDMSLVGPRPQVPADAGLYTEAERRMLTASPTPPRSSSPTKAMSFTEAPTRTCSTTRSSVRGKAASPWRISTTARFALISG